MRIRPLEHRLEKMGVEVRFDADVGVRVDVEAEEERLAQATHPCQMDG